MTPSIHHTTLQPIPSDLKTFLPHPQTPWNISSPLFNRLKAQQNQSFKTCKVLPSDPELNFILKYFEHQKPSSYGIRKVMCIHNPDQTGAFEYGIKNMERECGNLVFAPKGKEQEPKLDRVRVINRGEQQAAQFSPVEIKSSTARGNDFCMKAIFPFTHFVTGK